MNGAVRRDIDRCAHGQRWHDEIAFGFDGHAALRYAQKPLYSSQARERPAED